MNKQHAWQPKDCQDLTITMQQGLIVPSHMLFINQPGGLDAMRVWLFKRFMIVAGGGLASVMAG